MLKSLTKYIFWLVIVCIAFVVLSKADFLPSWNLFKSSPLKIDETPVLIKEIKTIAELSTITIFDEVVVDSTKFDPAAVALGTITGITSTPFGSLYPRLVLIAKGQVICGTNLKNLSDSAVKVIGDSVSVTIPPAEILDVIINPSGFETFIEHGNWDAASITRVKIKAREKIKTRALTSGILGRANERSVLLISEMLTTLGYNRQSVVVVR